MRAGRLAELNLKKIKSIQFRDIPTGSGKKNEKHTRDPQGGRGIITTNGDYSLPLPFFPLPRERGRGNLLKKKAVITFQL
jgi:hypothetical protein